MPVPANPAAQTAASGLARGETGEIRCDPVAPGTRTIAGDPLIKAMGHPLRFRILEALNAKQASPSSLAETLGAPIGNVAYHVQVLLECEAIELVSTRRVRGATEHIYRATTRPFFDDEQWGQLPPSVRGELQHATIGRFLQRLTDASRNGGLEDPRTHISWTPLELDEQGYEEVAALLDATLERALEIHAESAGRLVELPEEQRLSRSTDLTLLHYPRQAPDGSSGD